MPLTRTQKWSFLEPWTALDVSLEPIGPFLDLLVPGTNNPQSGKFLSVCAYAHHSENMRSVLKKTGTQVRHPRKSEISISLELPDFWLCRAWANALTLFTQNRQKPDRCDSEK